MNNIQKMKHFLHFSILDFSPACAEGTGILDFSPACAGGAGGESKAFEALIARTMLMNRCSTCRPVFADVSMKLQPMTRASDSPSSFETILSLILSHLLPTRIKIGFDVFTRSIVCQKASILSNDSLEATEYTRINPCPSLFPI